MADIVLERGGFVSRAPEATKEQFVRKTLKTEPKRTRRGGGGGGGQSRASEKALEEQRQKEAEAKRKAEEEQRRIDEENKRKIQEQVQKRKEAEQQRQKEQERITQEQRMRFARLEALRKSREELQKGLRGVKEPERRKEVADVYREERARVYTAKVSGVVKSPEQFEKIRKGELVTVEDEKGTRSLVSSDIFKPLKGKEVDATIKPAWEVQPVRGVEKEITYYEPKFGTLGFNETAFTERKITKIRDKNVFDVASGFFEKVVGRTPKEAFRFVTGSQVTDSTKPLTAKEVGMTPFRVAGGTIDIAAGATGLGVSQLAPEEGIQIDTTRQKNITYYEPKFGTLGFNETAFTKVEVPDAEVGIKTKIFERERVREGATVGTQLGIYAVTPQKFIAPIMVVGGAETALDPKATRVERVVGAAEATAGVFLATAATTKWLRTPIKKTVPLRETMKPKATVLESPPIKVGDKTVVVRDVRVVGEVSPPTRVIETTKGKELFDKTVGKLVQVGTKEPKPMLQFAKATEKPAVGFVIEGKGVSGRPMILQRRIEGQKGVEFFRVRGKSEKISLKEFNQLSRAEKLKLQKIAEEVAGRPVALKNVPKVLSEEREFLRSYTESVRLGQVKRTGKETFSFKPEKLGRGTKRQSSISESKVLEKGEDFDLIRLESKVDDVTFPKKVEGTKDTFIKVNEKITTQPFESFKTPRVSYISAEEAAQNSLKLQGKLKIRESKPNLTPTSISKPVRVTQKPTSSIKLDEIRLLKPSETRTLLSPAKIKVKSVPVTKGVGGRVKPSEEVETFVFQLKPPKEAEASNLVIPANIKKTPWSRTFPKQEQVAEEVTKIIPPSVIPKVKTPKPTTVVSEIKPSVVEDFAPRPAVAESQFAGTGQYELTSGGISPQMNMIQDKSFVQKINFDNKIDVKVKQVQLQQPKMFGKLDIQRRELLMSPEISQEFIDAQKRIIRQQKKSGQQLKQRQKQKSETKQVQELLQQQIQKVRQESRRKKESRRRFFPIPLPDKTPSVKKLISKVKKGEFTPIAVLKGQEVGLGTFRTKRQAEQALGKTLKTTLGASGFIEKSGVRLKAKSLLLGSEFTPSKVDPFKITEKKSKRLRKGTTGKSIQYFRKKKNKSRLL